MTVIWIMHILRAWWLAPNALCSVDTVAACPGNDVVCGGGGDGDISGDDATGTKAVSS